jgi:hypothetical protein
MLGRLRGMDGWIRGFIYNENFTLFIIFVEIGDGLGCKGIGVANLVSFDLLLGCFQAGRHATDLH